MAVIPERHKEKSQSNKLTKEKTFGSGSEFMPNVGRRRLLQSIFGGKDPLQGIGCGRVCTGARSGGAGRSRRQGRCAKSTQGSTVLRDATPGLMEDTARNTGAGMPAVAGDACPACENSWTFLPTTLKARI